MVGNTVMKIQTHPLSVAITLSLSRNPTAEWLLPKSEMEISQLLNIMF